MSFLHRLLLVASVAASITVCVTASSVRDELIRKLNDTKKEIEQVNNETRALTIELKDIEALIKNKTEEFSGELGELKNKNAATLNELEIISLNVSHLQTLVKSKKEIANYLQGLGEKVEFARSLTKEELELEETRRKRGAEEKCFAYQTKGKGNKSRFRKNAFSTGSTDDDTVEIVYITGQIDTAKENLFSAIRERDRLKFELESNKKLLEHNEKSWKADIDQQNKTVKEIKEKVESLQSVVKTLNKLINDLDELIAKIKLKIEEDHTAWKDHKSQLKTAYNKARACYEEFVPKIK